MNGIRKLTANARKKVAAIDPETLREEERNFARGIVGPLVEDMHSRLDANAAVWREQLRSLVKHGVPAHVHHEYFWRVACLDAMIQAVGRVHALYDQLAEEGVFETTPRAELDATRADFRRRRAAREAAVELELLDVEDAERKARREALEERLREAAAEGS